MRRRLLIICAISTITFFAGLGRAAITESDEAFYAEAGREMLAGRDWLTPHFNYELRFQKPILYYWIVAASYRVAGVTEAAARFGSALSGFGLTVLTFVAARRMFGDEVAFTSSVIVATNFGYFAMAHLSLPDLPLTFFISLAIWSGLIALDRPDARAPMLCAAAAAGLAVLTKGPLGVVLPSLVLVTIAVVEHQWRRIAPVRLAAGLLVFAAIAVPWYAAMTLTHGIDYLRGFFLADNLERFATTRFNDPRQPWYYLPVVAGGLLPWTPFAALLVRPAWRWARRRRRLSGDERRLAAWVLLPLAFFTISVGKQARYILPILPPLAILIARAIERRRASGASSSGLRAVRYAGLAAMFILCIVGVTMWRIRGLLAYANNVSTVANAASLIVVLAVAAGIVVVFGSVKAIVPALTVASALTLAALQYGVFSTPRSEPVEAAAEFILQERRANERIGVYNAFVRNLVFYTRVRHEGLYDDGQARAFLSSSDRVLCVLQRETADQFEREGVRLIRLKELRYFDPAAMKLTTALAPEPSRDLTAVVIVSNR